MSRKFMGKIIVQIVLLMFVILTLVPFLWTISTSLKETGEILSYPPSLLPKRVTLHNYIKVLTQDNFLRFMLNSTIVTVLSIAVTLLVSMFAGYGAARFHFPGKGFIMFMILTGMAVGRFANAMPMYFMANRLGLLDTYIILVFVYSAFCGKNTPDSSLSIINLMNSQRLSICNIDLLLSTIGNIGNFVASFANC